MSGGSYDYACDKISMMADNLQHTENPRRAAFQALLYLVSAACHDIEWADSCDGADEDKSIDAVFAFLKVNPVDIKKIRAYDSMIKSLKRIVEMEGK